MFFDLLGPPWPEHANRCIPYLVRYLIAVERVPSHQLRDRILAFAREHDVVIPDDILAQLREYTGGPRRPAVLRIAPGEDDTVLDGEVIEINRGVNFFRRFNFPETPMARAMLGELLRKSYCEVVMRERDEDTGQLFQFSFFARQRLVARAGLRVGSTAFVVLTPRRLPGKHRVWLAAQVQSDQA